MAAPLAAFATLLKWSVLSFVGSTHSLFSMPSVSEDAVKPKLRPFHRQKERLIGEPNRQGYIRIRGEQQKGGRNLDSFKGTGSSQG